MSGNQQKGINKSGTGNARIVFMGTPEFAIASLDALLINKFNIAGVVTAPDRQSGRGLKLQQSAVKKFAIKSSLPVLQPTNLKDLEFINTLKKIKPDILVVVGFRKLPDEVWKLPPLGTINLHASLLPQYRGAAPINWVLINGEKITGVTTFFIDDKIDTGKIIYQEKVEITPGENAGTLHDKLMNKGAELVNKTVKSILKGVSPQTDQSTLTKAQTELKKAPKLRNENCEIPWEKSAIKVYNFIRGLSPYPGAWTRIINQKGKTSILKIFKTEVISEQHENKPGTVLTDDQSYLQIAVDSGFVKLLSVQLPGKKQMDIIPFLRGFDTNGLMFIKS
ncbi:MAG: methionyl-tRNA formyltransferase [Bacteroidales bacterium]|nr:methionyl-tRNA formyltransferase [Bacteroidales bacterium]